MEACANCKGKGRAFNKYLNRWMCNKCFTKMIEDRIRLSIKNLFDKGDVVLVIDNGTATARIFSSFFPQIARRIPDVRMKKGARMPKNTKGYDKIAVCTSADEEAVKILNEIMLKGKKPEVRFRKGKMVFPTIRISEHEAEIYCRIKKLDFKVRKTSGEDRDMKSFLDDVEKRRKGAMFGLIKALLEER